MAQQAIQSFCTSERGLSPHLDLRTSILTNDGHLVIPNNHGLTAECGKSAPTREEGEGADCQDVPRQLFLPCLLCRVCDRSNVSFSEVWRT